MRALFREAADYLRAHPEKLLWTDSVLARHLIEVGIYSKRTRWRDLSISRIRERVAAMKFNLRYTIDGKKYVESFNSLMARSLFVIKWGETIQEVETWEA